MVGGIHGSRNKGDLPLPVIDECGGTEGLICHYDHGISIKIQKEVGLST